MGNKSNRDSKHKRVNLYVQIDPWQWEALFEEYRRGGVSEGVRDIITEHYENTPEERLKKRERKIKEVAELDREIELDKQHDHETEIAEAEDKRQKRDKEIAEITKLILRDTKYFSKLNDMEEKVNFFRDNIEIYMNKLKAFNIDPMGFLEQNKEKEGVPELLEFIAEREDHDGETA